MIITFIIGKRKLQHIYRIYYRFAIVTTTLDAQQDIFRILAAIMKTNMNMYRII